MHSSPLEPRNGLGLENCALHQRPRAADVRGGDARVSCGRDGIQTWRLQVAIEEDTRAVRGLVFLAPPAGGGHEVGQKSCVLTLLWIETDWLLLRDAVLLTEAMFYLSEEQSGHSFARCEIVSGLGWAGLNLQAPEEPDRDWAPRWLTVQGHY